MTNANEPAFPFIYHDREGDERAISGITVREYFAAMAMQGMYANYQLVSEAGKTAAGGKLEGITHGKQIISISAVQAADALIEALNKQP